MTGTERYTHGYHEVILEFYRRRAAISAAFRRWADNPSGFWAWLNGEVVAVKPGSAAIVDH